MSPIMHERTSSFCKFLFVDYLSNVHCILILYYFINSSMKIFFPQSKNNMALELDTFKKKLSDEKTAHQATIARFHDDKKVIEATTEETTLSAIRGI